MNYGDKGPAVRAAQVALGDAGHDPGPTDGILGDRTWDALRRYSRDLVLGWTPEVPQEVIDTLLGLGPTVPPPGGGSVPCGAIFEADLGGGVALYDVSHALPTHASKKYPIRTRAVEGVVVHHSGADGADGFLGLVNHASYCVEHSDWAGAAYHVWVSGTADRDGEGRIAVYRANPDETLAWATGGCNEITMGLGFQGDLSERMMTPDQRAAFEPLVGWMLSRHSLRTMALGLHSEAHRWGGRPKASCPGPFLTEMVRRYRGAL